MVARPVVLPTTTNVARPSQAGYEGRIDELLLRLSITPESQLEINLVPAQAPRIALGGALQAIPDAALVASLGDVAGGEGLFHTSRARTEGDQTRFWRSRGIDTSAGSGGRAPGFRLLHATELAVTDVSVTTPHMVILGQEVSYADGPDVKTIASVLGAASSLTEDPFPASSAVLTGLVAVGGDMWASAMISGGGLSKRASPGPSWAVTGILGDVVGLWSAKERLFAQIGNVLHEINQTTGASAAVVLTMPAGRVVTAVADAGDAVLVSSDAGKVYVFALDASSTLVLTSEARVGLSDNEYVSCMAEGFGVVLFGTREATTAAGTIGRLYVGEVSSAEAGHRVTDIQLVRQFPTEATNKLRHPTRIAFKGASAYIAVIGNGESVLWRYQLATSGLSEDLVFPVEAAIYGLAVLEDRLVVSLAGVGLWREDDVYRGDGWIISPLSDFGYATEKAWAWVNLTGHNLGGGNTIEVALTADATAMDDPASASWTTVLVLYDAAGLGQLAPVFDYAERAVAMKIDLNSSGAGSTPTASTVSVYAYPVADELRIKMPINVSDRIERPGRTPVNVRGWGNHYFRDILARRGLPAELELYRQQLVLRGRVSDVATATPGRGERSSGLLITWVTFEGRATTVGTPGYVGPTTLGLPLLGVGTLGV